MDDRTFRIEPLDVRGMVSQAELASGCGLSVLELEELVDYGLLAPLGGSALSRTFSAGAVRQLREAAALRNRFDLDLFALGLLYSQLERIAHLEQQLRSQGIHAPQPGAHHDGPTPWREPHG